MHITHHKSRETISRKRYRVSNEAIYLTIDKKFLCIKTGHCNVKVVLYYFQVFRGGQEVL